MTNPRESWQPNTLQSAVLNAALLKGSQAVEAWADVQSALNSNALDPASRRLLPLVYRNLRIIAPELPIESLRMLHRRTWSKNQLLFYQLGEILNVFEAAEIKTLILKGAALTVQYYRDNGLRSMEDVDVMVHPADAPHAIKLLREIGWKSEAAHPENQLGAWHAANFTDARGLGCDLHWRAFAHYYRDGMDEGFWEAATPMTVQGNESRTLSNAHQIVHLCLHGSVWEATPTIRWIPDVCLVAQSAEEADWDQVVGFAERFCLSLPLRRTLDFVRSTYDASVPERVIAALNSQRVNRREEQEYAVITSEPGTWSLALRNWHRYSQVSGDTPLLTRLIGFPAYLQQRWDVDRLWKVPMAMIARGFRRQQ